MDAGTIIAIVTSACALIAALSAVFSPFMSKKQDAEIERKKLLAAYAREDEREARQTAKTEAVKVRAEEVARLLVVSTEAQADAARVQSGKLDTIHTLVNNTLTTAKRASLDAKLASRVMLLRVIADAPREEDADALAVLDLEIAELRAEVDDRNSAAAQVAQAHR